ncbi:hypothetical protein [Rummeliibacillus pycnus]|uniref:hypothetical protein n=1 Tax=Rummeliibacillus pycnus TaxID=101070 RepID=UPI0037C538FA
MKVLRTTYINLTKVQTIQFPFNHEFLGIKLDGDLVKVAYIENQIQDGFCDMEFRIYQPNEVIDFDSNSYAYIGLIEHNDLDYHVFCKNVRQIQDFR